MSRSGLACSPRVRLRSRCLRSRSRSTSRCGASFVFFSLSAGKQDLYIFPIVSAVAALGGIAIERGLTDPTWRTWLTRTLAATGALLALASAAVLYLFDTAGRIYALDGALVV